MAASRLLRAVAACAILLSFAAGLRKSHWSGCIKGATVISSAVNYNESLIDDIWEGTRWEEMSWDKVRRAQMRWNVECEECSVKCGAWRVQCEVWSLECEGSSEKWEVWNVKCEVWSVKFGVQRVQCEVWSVKCEVWSLECEESSEKWEVWSVKCKVRSVKCEVWSVKEAVRSVKCGLWSAQYYCLLQLDFVNRIGVGASRVRQWLVVVLGIIMKA